MYDPLLAYVAVVANCPDESLDFVVVDSHYRSACIAAVVPKIKPGGLLWSTMRTCGRAMPPVPREWPEVSND